ncbi:MULTISPECIES: MBL fold metallo-hydrolase [Fervidobacterium]|uniref:Beta-lactamase domain protein n=1 Tax=Fervidobacterium nodosum (strain ATCC 35602 / DSM 5306 / Rt17-B1) TaxID=381764 RepID=A7HLG2_FERNB|nr:MULTISPECIES: MBL fold metallo-hydrolase [Fervidobacterium]ABS60745.1 beta-lactamase domain protein [Fervidobacterium nodosum Rt17-B1]KAF2960894.1 MBL fold metallo-hydrolase [Fervidobacterium sp. 2310opik-2]PHJ14201.1 beta-lactamase [Fervidobacterium sp. SC_NGM5_G05]
MNFIAFSKALYSTWIYYSPERILFDAGEGVATMLSNKIYAVRHIFLTHGHVDHIAGLWSIINTRNNAMGDREKPLTVYYPEGNKGIEFYAEFLKRANNDLRFELIFVPVKKGENVFLRKSGSFIRYVQPFQVNHTYSEVAFGYHVIDVRRRLKEEYRDLPKEEISNLAKKLGSEEITEAYEKKVLTISGDTVLLKKEDIMDTEILFHECTFLNREDRKFNNHASLDDIVELVKDSNVKNLVLYHISSRYVRGLEKAIKKINIPGTKIFYVHPERIFEF